MSPAAKSRPESSWRKYRRSVDKSDTPTAYDPRDRPGISARSSWPSRGCGGRRRSGCAAGDVDRLSCRGLGIGLCMLKKVEIEIDDDLGQEARTRYPVDDGRGAVHLALRTLLEGEDSDVEQDEEYDEFSDPSAWQPHRNRDTG